MCAGLSPIAYEHINFLGRYAFTRADPDARPAGDARGMLKAGVVTDRHDRPRTDRPAYCAYTKGP
jgi:hypothetical protein